MVESMEGVDTLLENEKKHVLFNKILKLG